VFVGRVIPPREDEVEVMVVVVATALTVNVTVMLPTQAFESVAETVSGKFPACVGIPERRPAEVRLMGVGRVPVSENVIVPTPPVCANC
jgi:hypothetical protein